MTFWWVNRFGSGGGQRREEGGIDQQCRGPLHLPCMCNDPNYPSQSASPSPSLQNPRQTLDSMTTCRTQGSLCQSVLPCKMPFSFPSPLSAATPSTTLHPSPNPMHGHAGYLIISPLFQFYMVVGAKSPPFFLQVDTKSSLLFWDAITYLNKPALLVLTPLTQGPSNGSHTSQQIQEQQAVFRGIPWTDIGLSLFVFTLLSCRSYWHNVYIRAQREIKGSLLHVQDKCLGRHCVFLDILSIIVTLGTKYLLIKKRRFFKLQYAV